MKFNLDAKYFLIESKQILEERFTLLEATNEEIISTAMNQILERIETIIASKNDDTKIKAEIDELSQLLYSAKQATEPLLIKSKINDYINKFKKLIGANLDKNENLKNSLDEIESITNPIDQTTKDETLTQVKNLLTAFNNNFSGILNNQDKSVIEALESAKVIINEIKESPEILTDGTNTDDLKQILQELYGALPAADKLDSVQDSDIKEACNNFADQYELLKTSTDVESKTNNSWDNLFKEAAGDNQKLSQAWEKYYAEFWGDQALDVKRLGTAFINETNYFGYTKATNPFITFLKGLFAKGIKPNANVYGIIHNLYVRRYIDEADLVSVAETNPTEKGLLLGNASLYTKGSSEINRLFELMKNVLVVALPQKNELLKKRYPASTGKRKFIIDLFFKPGDPISPIEKRGDINGQIKDTDLIEQQLEASTGTKVEKKGSENPYNDEMLLKIIGNKQNATEALKYLTLLYKSDAPNVIKDIFTKAKITDPVFNINNAPELMNVFKKAGVNKDSADKSITALLKTYFEEEK